MRPSEAAVPVDRPIVVRIDDLERAFPNEQVGGTRLVLTQSKCWLASDEIQRASDAFQRACDLMPTFSGAFSNPGATLGELDRPEAALAAFEQAFVTDPDRFVLLNDIGVVTRELGRLDESEATFRRVVAIAPEFVFGHYNLGHTAFLRGKYREALAAYEEGHRRDPENSRQGRRLAIVRFANGDVAGAERDLRRFIDAASPEGRQDLLNAPVARRRLRQAAGVAARAVFGQCNATEQPPKTGSCFETLARLNRENAD